MKPRDPFDVPTDQDAADVLSGGHPKSDQVDESWGMEDPMDDCNCDPELDDNCDC